MLHRYKPTKIGFLTLKEERLKTFLEDKTDFVQAEKSSSKQGDFVSETGLNAAYFPA
jgi:hypothetical protein